MAGPDIRAFEVGGSLCFPYYIQNIYVRRTALLWSLTMVRMRAVVLGTLNVYSANHNNPPTLRRKTFQQSLTGIYRLKMMATHYVYCVSADDSNTCNSDPCQAGSTCISDNGGYVCHCTEGYTGTNCETCEYGTNRNLTWMPRHPVGLSP